MWAKQLFTVSCCSLDNIYVFGLVLLCAVFAVFAVSALFSISLTLLARGVKVNAKATTDGAATRLNRMKSPDCGWGNGPS